MTRKTSQWAAADAINAATDFLARNASGNVRVPYSVMLAWIQANSGGAAGKNPEFQNAGGYLQWRLIGDATWNNLVALSAISGLGVPAGGAVGQMLVKKTDADNDTQWIDPPAGGGGGLPVGGTAGMALVKKSSTDGDVEWKAPMLLTGDQTVAGKKKFTDALEISAGSGLLISTLSQITTTPTSGSTLALTPGVSYQLMKPAADLAALSVQLPDWPNGGMVINLVTTKRVAAATFLGGVHNAGTSLIIGAPASLEVGITSMHYFINDNAWYFYK